MDSGRLTKLHERKHRYNTTTLKGGTSPLHNRRDFLSLGTSSLDIRRELPH
jgi:hypothetical protein